MNAAMTVGANSQWPDLPFAAWRETCDTLLLWTQIVGKAPDPDALLLGFCRKPAKWDRKALERRPFKRAS
jgi:Family of unknown function (DUF5996)